VPGDGIFYYLELSRWSRTGRGFLAEPQPLTARTAHEWGVVSEVVPNVKRSASAGIGRAVFEAPEVTRRNTRVHFIQPLKERIVREVGYGLVARRSIGRRSRQIDASQE